MHRLRLVLRALPRSTTLARPQLLERPHLRVSLPFTTTPALAKKKDKNYNTKKDREYRDLHEPRKDDKTPRGAHKTSVEGGAAPFIPEEHWARLETTLEKVMADLTQRLSYLRRGVADPRRLSGLMVQLDKEGRVNVPLGKVAHVTSKGRAFAILVHEQDNVQKVVSAIHNAGLNLHPVVNPGNPLLLTVPLPPPTKEWRHEVGTSCHNVGMVAQNAINKARSDFHRNLANSRKQLRPDDYTKWEKRLFPLTRKYKDDATAQVTSTKEGIYEDSI